MQTPSIKCFPVESMGKFTILFFSTMGLYSYYWFYRNWVAAEAITGQRMFKIGRTLFAIFFVHQLFGLVQAEQKTEAQQHRWQPKTLAGIIVGLGVMQLMIALLHEKYEISHWWDLLLLCFELLLMFYVLYTVQLVINRIAGDPFGNANKIFNGVDIAWFVFGIFLWLNMLSSHYMIATGKLPPPGSLLDPPAATPPTPPIQNTDPLI